MKDFEKSYIDMLIRDLQTAKKGIQEAFDYSTINKWNLTWGWLSDVKKLLDEAIGSIQRESGTIYIDSHQELIKAFSVRQVELMKLSDDELIKEGERLSESIAVIKMSFGDHPNLDSLMQERDFVWNLSVNKKKH